jgi:hypothetical protein
MKIAARIVLSAIPVLFGFSANAFDLDGAWTPDAENCGKVFAKRNNEIQISRRADFFGGGFVVKGNKIRGPFLTCTIDHRSEDGAMVNLLASCAAVAVPLSPIQFSLRIENDDKITRVFSSFPGISISYVRCKL